jgi:hypothetical protein
MIKQFFASLGSSCLKIKNEMIPPTRLNKTGTMYHHALRFLDVFPVTLFGVCPDSLF